MEASGPRDACRRNVDAVDTLSFDRAGCIRSQGPCLAGRSVWAAWTAGGGTRGSVHRPSHRFRRTRSAVRVRVSLLSFPGVGRLAATDVGRRTGEEDVVALTAVTLPQGLPRCRSRQPGLTGQCACAWGFSLAYVSCSDLSSQGAAAVTTSDLVGLRIKTVRRQRGLSQAQLAHPELSDSYVSLIEER